MYIYARGEGAVCGGSEAALIPDALVTCILTNATSTATPPVELTSRSGFSIPFHEQEGEEGATPGEVETTSYQFGGQPRGNFPDCVPLIE